MVCVEKNDDVIVNERGDMDQLEDDGKLVMIVVDPAGGTPGEESKSGTYPFARGVQNVGHVRFHGRVKLLGLSADARLHSIEFRPQESKRRKFAAARRV